MIYRKYFNQEISFFGNKTKKITLKIRKESKFLDEF